MSDPFPATTADEQDEPPEVPDRTAPDWAPSPERLKELLPHGLDLDAYRPAPPPRGGRRRQPSRFGGPAFRWGAPDPLDPNLLQARPWAPMTDAEWEAIAPFLWAMGCGFRGAPGVSAAGRPLADPRARLDAIFRSVTLKREVTHPRTGQPVPARACWCDLPPGYGRPDSVSRLYRRWARLGDGRASLWARLLIEVTDPAAAPALRGMAHWICCAFRRGIRLMGLRAILLARRIRQHSALPGPPHWLPDPDLSEALARAFAAIFAAPDRWPLAALFGRLRQLLPRCFGRRSIPRWAEPA
jgi:hypothetical protein